MFALQRLHSQESSLPTFHNQRSLPRLPVPPLHATLTKYIKSLEPLIAEDEAKGGPQGRKELEKRKAWAAEFETGLGARCQQRLIDLDRCSPHNWLDDNFWLKKAYLEWRAPLLINSNWWLALRDDANVPPAVRQGKLADNGEANVWQVRRAAWFTSRLLQFKESLEKEEIPPDATRAGPLCMSHYTRMFHYCRIPRTGCDALTRPPMKDSNEGRHILFMYKDWFYEITVYNGSGTFIGVAELEKRIWSVIRDVESRHLRGEKAVPIGVLSADERNRWAENREHLLTLSPQNRTVLSSIENSLFALSLDTHTLPPHGKATPVTMPLVDAHLRNVASGGGTARNRWFDKAISVCVETNARVGMMGEHSPCDALIPSILGDYAVAVDMDVSAFGAGNKQADVAGWARLDFVADERIKQECVEAESRAKAIIEDSDDSMLWFDEFGTSWMKQAGVSPDAFIQMALQLTFYKSQGFLTATYETASTRLFKHGRTDVIRTLSSESRRFVLSMVSPFPSQATRLSHLKAAVQAHNAYTRDASKGLGADRHLMSLRLVMREGERSELFEDELFARSQDWKLSTSGLSSGERFIGTGFGSPWPDGYGINYLAAPDMVKFGIESKKSCPTTSTERFKACLVQSLREMQAVCIEGLPVSVGEQVGEVARL